MIWLIIGLVIYFNYSYKNSVLGKQKVNKLEGLD